MSTASISDVMADLFSATLNAAVTAERDYLRIWAEWLRFKKDLITDGNIQTILETAPVVEIDGTISLSISMRLASVEEKKGEFGVGLSVGPFYSSGAYGSSNQTTAESVLNAAAVSQLYWQK